MSPNEDVSPFTKPGAVWEFRKDGTALIVKDGKQISKEFKWTYDRDNSKFVGKLPGAGFSEVTSSSLKPRSKELTVTAKNFDGKALTDCWNMRSSDDNYKCISIYIMLY